jgi:hypothetical protein
VIGHRLSLVFRHGWACPYTLLGLGVYWVPFLGTRNIIRYRGTIGVVGPGVERILRLVPIPGGAAALTLGHAILATSEDTFLSTWEHEWVHVQQYERWGPAFVPAYLVAGLWQRMRGRDAYWDNPFEVEAREKC